MLFLMVHFYFTHTARGKKTYGFLHTSYSNSTLQLYQNASCRKAQSNEKWPFFDPLQIRSTNSYKSKKLCFIIQQTSPSTLLIMIIFMWMENVKCNCHSVLSHMKEKELQVHSPSNKYF